MGDSSPWQLVVMHLGKSWTVALDRPGAYRIGRADECEVRIEEGRVSRLHAVLTAAGAGGVSITDRNSQNGTTLVAPPSGAGRAAERRLEPGEEVRVPAGAMIHVGSAVLMVTEAIGAAVADAHRLPGLVVRDPAMGRLHDLIDRVAASELPILFRGEGGVGKEVLARRLHEASPRAGGRFVSVKCASLDADSLEAELFGEAPASGVSPRPGLFEVAAGGTLYLEEVGELPGPLQARLVRALEERQFTPRGGGEVRAVDVRLVASTHRKLDEEVAAGRFRRDLYFRLSGVAVDVPPLRARVAEIEPLARHFLDQAAARSRRPPPTIGADARDAILRYSWPGNVRELCNVIERALILCAGDELEAEHLGLRASGALPLPMSPRAPTLVDED